MNFTRKGRGGRLCAFPFAPLDFARLWLGSFFYLAWERGFSSVYVTGRGLPSLWGTGARRACIPVGDVCVLSSRPVVARKVTRLLTGGRRCRVAAKRRCSRLCGCLGSRAPSLLVVSCRVRSGATLSIVACLRGGNIGVPRLVCAVRARF